MSNLNKRRNMRNRWSIIFLPFLILSLSGWFWSEQKEDVPVVTGVWKSMSLPKSVLINFDSSGGFKADLAQEGLANITGDFRVIGDQVIFDDDRTTSDTVCRDRGYYYFGISNEELRLILIADSCSPRRSILSGHWKLVSSPVIDKKKKKIK